MKDLLRYFNKSELFWVSFLVTFQQIFNTLGTYAISKAGLTYQDHTQFSMWVLICFLSFLFAPVVNIFVRRAEGWLNFNCYGRYLDGTVYSKVGQTSLWQSQNTKERFLASIGEDAFNYLSMVLFTRLDIYSFFLSIVLAVLTLSFTIDMSLLPAFAVSGILSLFVYRFFSPQVGKLYTLGQTSQTDLAGHLLKSWDNLLLQNRGIHRNYRQIFDQKIQAAQSDAMKANTTSEVLVFILGLATGLPVLASALWILRHSHSPEILIALLATLPRQLQILGLFRNIYVSLTNLLIVKSKFKVLLQGTQLIARDLVASIRMEELKVNGQQFESLEEAIQAFRDRPKGRFEIRGPNGSGKSTLLLHLNRVLESSIYLPTHPNLMIRTEIIEGQSSGERLLSHIEMVARSEEPIALLDEWDANLDEVNLVRINQLINGIAKSKTVVEVRHRSSNGLNVAVRPNQ